MAVNVDLIIPGLFDLPVDELGLSFLNLKLPALNQFLRFGRLRQNQAFDLESMLIQAMGWSGLQTLPLAQAHAKHEMQDSDKILLFKAIHLKADMHNAIVVPLENNRINYDNITIIINDLKDLFKVDCDIHEVQHGLWLIRLKQTTPAQHYPHYLSIIGRKVDPFIEQSKQALPWYKLMNEMQMFMHQHEINHNRFEKGLLPINSLWFWGSGDLSKLTTKNLNWYCDDELLEQFASIAGISCAGLDEVKTHQFSRDSIIIDLTLLEALKSRAEASLQTILTNLETRLFEPLLRRVKANRCKLRLRAGSTNDLILGRYSTYSWWRKSKTLLDFTRL